jgi:hypothetical protein
VRWFCHEDEKSQAQEADFGELDKLGEWLSWHGRDIVCGNWEMSNGNYGRVHPLRFDHGNSLI